MRHFSLPFALLLVSSLAGPAPGQDAVASGPSDAAARPLEVEPAASVVVWNREIVELRAKLGSFTAEQRTGLVIERILALPEESLQAPVEVQPTRLNSLSGFDLVVDGVAVLTVVESDVDPALGETLPEMVERARVSLQELLRARADQRSLPLLLRGAGLTVAATVALAIVLRLLTLLKRGVIRRARTRVAHSERLRARDLDLRPYVAEAFERLVGVVNLVAVGAALYFWLEFVLGLFPYTVPWSRALDDWLSGLLRWGFQGIVGAVPGLVTVAVVFFVTRGLARTITLIVSRIERRAERVEGFAPESVRATRRLAVVIVWIFGIVFAYPHLPGADSDAFKGISVLIGLMISLGSTGFVSQLMSGFVVLYSRSVRGGEVVRIAGFEGQVTDLGLLAIKLLLPSGEQVSIPNAVVVTQATTNFSRGPEGVRAVASVSVTIGYDVPWRQVRALLLLAAERTEGVVRDPGPRVAQQALADWYVEYVLVLQVEDGKQRAAVLSRLHAAIQDAFNEFGVQIMSPHFVAQPDGSVLVERGREEPEPAPRFRFAKEAPPASFDPVEKAAQERAAREAEEAAKAERARLRAERGAAEKAQERADAGGDGADEAAP